MKKNSWNSENIGNQTGRVAIVTGSSSGIGLETARVLASKGAEVIMAVRNMQKGEEALAEIKVIEREVDITLMVLDLASLSSVERFASAFKINYDRLDLLINNAGVMAPPYSKTLDGFELQFGTNHLGHFALTGHLMELLMATTGSRVVNVSSAAHNFGNIDFSDLGWQRRKYKKWRAYGDSKIANLYFTYELRRRYGANENHVTFAAAHPGWTATDLQRHTGLVSFLNHFFSQNIPMGALPTLYAATANDVESGDYYGPSGFQEMKGYPKKVKSNALSYDKPIAKKLWEASEQLTGVRFQVYEKFSKAA